MKIAEEEERRDERERVELLVVRQVHEEDRDERRLRGRDGDGDEDVRRAEVVIRDLHREDRQDDEREEDADVELRARDVHVDGAVVVSVAVVARGA